jgi:hypothetical protein
MFVAFSALATGTLCAAAMLRRTTQSQAVPILLAVAGGLSYVSAVFRADGEHAGTTLHGEIHQTAEIVTFILIVAAMFAGAHTFRRDERWTSLTCPTPRLRGSRRRRLLPHPGRGRRLLRHRPTRLPHRRARWLLLVAIHGRRLAVTSGHRSRACQPGHEGAAVDS